MEMGVSATDLKRLKEAGFYTVDSLFMRPRKVQQRRGASHEAALTRASGACCRKRPQRRQGRQDSRRGGEGAYRARARRQVPASWGRAQRPPPLLALRARRALLRAPDAPPDQAGGRGPLHHWHRRAGAGAGAMRPLPLPLAEKLPRSARTSSAYPAAAPPWTKSSAAASRRRRAPFDPCAPPGVVAPERPRAWRAPNSAAARIGAVCWEGARSGAGLRGSAPLLSAALPPDASLALLPEHHGDVRRVSNRQDADVPHALRHQPDVAGAGRRRGQGVLVRCLS